VHIDERLAHVTSDATKLKRVLYHLIANSLQHASGTGKLSISLQRLNADSFRMEVKDSGPGLPQPLLAHVNTAPTSDAAVSGLSLTRRLVAALGGSLRAFNDKPSGAVFRVELPVHPAAARPYLRST
jgi:signal transduction histidine kinase